MKLVKTTKRVALGLAVALTSMSFAPAVQASTVELQYEGDNVWGSPRWARNVTYQLNGTSYSHGAGLFRLEETATGRSILAWCIDLAQRIGRTTTYDTMTPVTTAAQMMNIDLLFTSGYASVTDRDSAAGFQLALWEIMTDTGSAEGLDLSTGNFTTNGDSARYTAAASFLANMGTQTGGYNLTTYYSDRRQDLVSATAVPLPASALLLLSGVAGAGFAGRRRRKA